MRILVIDKYNQMRDLAQMDMYDALSQKYDIIYANYSNITSLIKQSNYDLLYLGIYHPWCGLSPTELEEILKINKKPVIIDQADNESFIARKNFRTLYNDSNCILLSRYLPNKILNEKWKGKLFSLPWYINLKRFIPQEKILDVAFICMIQVKRLGSDRKKMSEDIFDYCEKNGLKHKIGEYFIEYSDIITKSKSMVIDGSRYCLTQKYIEAALSNCIIIGQKPTSPPNEFITVNLQSIRPETIDSFNEITDFNRNYAIENFANKDKFLNNFEKIFLNF